MFSDALSWNMAFVFSVFYVYSVPINLLVSASVANESTRRRVIVYSIGEYVLLALASGLQVAYIRRLFSKSVAYNRV